MPLTTVNPGDPLKIPADTYNAFVNAATHHQTRSGGGPPEPRKQTNKLIDIRNKSGGNVGRGAVLGIIGPAVLPGDVEDEFFDSLVIDGVTPTAEHIGNGRFVVTAEPLTADSTGKGYAAGVLPCLVDMKSVQHTAADVAVGVSANLVSGTGPITILWADSTTTNGGSTDGTGVQAAMVRFGARLGQVFPVDLTLVSGSAGDFFSQTSFIYDVFDIEGIELATNVDPISFPHRCRREAIGPHEAAGHGLASYLPSPTGPTLVLVYTNEVLDTGKCPQL